MRADFTRSPGWVNPVLLAPATNQAESPRPRDSYAARYRAAVYARNVVRNTPSQLLQGQELKASGLLTPYPGYYDYHGAFKSRIARNGKYPRSKRYGGILPLTMQPQLQKPDPWSDPTRSMDV